LSCKLQTPALLPTHVTVGLPQMEGVAYSAICDATFMSRRVIRVPRRGGSAFSYFIIIHIQIYHHLRPLGC
jgi:hypothetical protein